MNRSPPPLPPPGSPAADPATVGNSTSAPSMRANGSGGAWASRPGATQSVAASTPASVGQPHARSGLDISWTGSPWSLTGLAIANTLLTIITLGCYNFWGKTEVRRRIWSSVRMHGEPLRYTGTGKELLLGFLVVFGLVLLPVMVITIGAMFAFGPESMAANIVQVVLYAVFFFLIGVAAYRARRYRLSRTNWRGIRGTMTGSSLKYALIAFFSAFLYPLTLGWIGPWRATMLQRRITNETTLGNRPLTFDGSAGPVYARYTALWFGTLLLIFGAAFAIGWLLGPKLQQIATAVSNNRRPPPMSNAEIGGILGIAFGAFCIWSVISAWYKASMANHFARSTNYEGARFSLAIGARGLIWLFITNMALLIVSLGILKPVAEARMARYFVQNLRLDGEIDLAAIAQSEGALGSSGEGLAQAFDVDAF